MPSKIKIQRVKRVHKKVSTSEKVLGALGVGSTLVTGAAGVSVRPPQTRIMSSDSVSKSSVGKRVQRALSTVFGISEAHAAAAERPSVTDVSDDEGSVPAVVAPVSIGSVQHSSIPGAISDEGLYHVGDQLGGSGVSAAPDSDDEVEGEEQLGAVDGNDDEVEAEELEDGDGEIEVSEEEAAAADADGEVEASEVAEVPGEDAELELSEEDFTPAGQTSDEEIEQEEVEAGAIPASSDAEVEEPEEDGAALPGGADADEEFEVSEESESGSSGSANGATFRAVAITPSGPAQAAGGNSVVTSSGGGIVQTQLNAAAPANFSSTASRSISYDEIVSSQSASGSSAAAPSAASVTYTVRRGDTLSGISAQFYGDASRWREIMSANAGVVKNPRTLKIGTVLTIPGARTQVTASQLSGGSYTVRSGDTLWDLAGTFYGDNQKWTVLRDANVGKFSDERHIPVGTTLVVPGVSAPRALGVSTAAPARAAPVQRADTARAPVKAVAPVASKPSAPAVAMAQPVKTSAAVSFRGGSGAPAVPSNLKKTPVVEENIIRPSVTDVGTDGEGIET